MVYLGFTAGALTDENLRDAGAFTRGEEFHAWLTEELRAGVPWGLHPATGLRPG